MQVHDNSIPQAIAGVVATLCIFLLSPTGSITLVSSLREITAMLHLKPSTWGNQRGARSHQANFWRRCRGLKEVQVDESRQHLVRKQFLAPLSDSRLRDRGVAHYLLSLLFSLVSLLYSFHFSVLNQKYQKYLLLLWFLIKTLTCVTSLVTTIVILSALLLPPLPLQHLLMRL